MAESNTINQILATKVDAWSEYIALEMLSNDIARTYTYAKLVKCFKKGAEQIKKAKVKEGDRIVLISENCPEWVIAYLAALEVGATVVLIDPKYGPGDLSRMIGKSDPRLLILSPSIFEKLSSDDTLGLPVLNLTAQLMPFEKSPKQVPSVVPPTADPDPEVASIIFTSGTGGYPKGVLVTHKSLLYCAQSALDIIKVDVEKKKQRCLCILPLHHMSGLTSVLIGPLLGGATVTFLETIDQESIFTAFKTTKTTVFTAVPRFYDLIYKGIVNQIAMKGRLIKGFIWGLGSFSYWLRSLTSLNIGPLLFRSIHKAFGGELKYFFCGGASLDSEVKIGMEKLGFTMLEGYGLTETGVCVYNTPDETRKNHVGKSCKGTVIRIDHADPFTGEGEVCISGISLMKGYFRDEEATAEVLRDGWLYTGDLGYLNTKGNLVITGRIKDIIITPGGKKASPSVVEDYYRGLTRVTEMAVFGMPAREGVGESVHAAVILEPEANSSEEKEQEARQKVWQEIEARSVQIPIYLRIQKVHFVKELPKTTTLKVSRIKLQQLIKNKLASEQVKIDRNSKGLSSKEVVLDREALNTLPPDKQVEALKAYLLSVASNVLKRDLAPSDLDESILALGFDSLNATSLVNELRGELDWEIPLELLLKGTSIAQLATRWKHRKPEQSINSVPLTATSREGNLPLSFAQERLWFLSQLEGVSATYNIPGAVRISGSLEVKILQQALSEIVRRHEVLRTSFHTVDSTPIQRINQEVTMDLKVMDLQPLEVAERDVALKEQIRLEANIPFDLEVAPLIRCRLLQLEAEHYVLLLTMHHIIADGWSIGILIKELSTVYQASCAGEPSPLAKLPIQYADFAIWQKQWLKGGVQETQLNYWRSQLEGVPQLLQLPTDRPRPKVQTYRGATKQFTLNTELTQKLRTLSHNSGATLFMTLQAAFATLLYCYTGQSDILIGTPIANRNRREIEPLIGFFVNTLVLRNRFEGDPSFEKLLAQIKDTTLKAYEHQDIPFEKVIDALHPERSLSYSPLFQVMFVLQNSPVGEMKLPGLTLSELVPESAISKFDLTLSMTETDEGLASLWEYSTGLFDDSTIERMVNHFENVLLAIVDSPQVSVGKLCLLSEVERHRLLVTWNDTGTEYSRKHCIHEVFEAQVENTPHAIAVVFGEQQLSYEELNKRSNQLARYLIKRGVKKEVRVGVCVERSLEMVIGLLGVLKAGGAYVPLDPSYPLERLRYILDDSEASLVLTQSKLLELLPDLFEYKNGTLPVILDEHWNDIAGVDSQQSFCDRAQPHNLAYVIYTSGSTGKPKGVAVNHESVLNTLYFLESNYPVSVGDSYLLKTNNVFDVSISELLGWFVGCGHVVILPPDAEKSPEILIDCIDKHKITHVNFAPSMLSVFVEQSRQNDTFIESNSLKYLMVAGEAFPKSLVKECVDTFSRAQVENIYGPTESSIYSARFSCSNQNISSINTPIGKPIANTALYIVDEQLNPVPIGVTGELCIAGRGLARGYLNSPELTAEKFIDNPFSAGTKLYKTGDLARWLNSGDIEYVGRTDNQVKIRGFRIELGEIESALTQQPGVREAVVLANSLGEGSGGSLLAAYVVCEESLTIDKTSLRSALKDQLPHYMIPSFFIFLDELPLTPNGKVNRKALPLPDQDALQTQDYVAPRTEMEKVVAEIWAEILALPQDKVGVHDNFFDLGGHSLLLAQLHSRLSQQLEQPLSMLELFQYPTIQALANYLNQKQNDLSGIVTISNQTEMRRAGKAAKKKRKQQRLRV
ncbi:MAG: amino acid adenylation domain-containing protein [Exilibacterium sp.]